MGWAVNTGAGFAGKYKSIVLFATLLDRNVPGAEAVNAAQSKIAGSAPAKVGLADQWNLFWI